MSSETPLSEQSPQAASPQPEPAFGWTPYAEQINGRFAMIGFVALLILELLTGQGLLSWLGL
ncbi:chlorophyll a/b-binding protein [Lyngbya aestuarii]|uniref:chlorophyll a/b-binding protein n=1 Tax=Lyngbya aestuarii TaxID=118322 RepID=UPI00403E1D0D